VGQFQWDVQEEDAKTVMFDRNVFAMNERAMAFIDHKAAEDPFFLVMSYVDPHRGDADDGSRYGPGKNIKFPRVKMGLPPEPTEASDIVPFPFLGLDSTEIREELADYYGAVDRLDIGVGNLIEQLQERGLWDDTVVIFVSDHGPDVTRGKMAVYESATRIPFLLKIPGVSGDIVREELVSTVDIFPTILELAGASDMASGPGRSLVPLTQADSASAHHWREYLFTEYITHTPNQFYPRYSVRDARYKLIYNVLGGVEKTPFLPSNYCNAWWESRKPEYLDTPIRAVYDRVASPPQLELYDLHSDPYEWNNLADEPEYALERDRLLNEIQSWRQATEDPLLTPAGFSAEQHNKLQPKS
jgi:N-sulfoglucosamine sulfohydrolase